MMRYLLLATLILSCDLYATSFSSELCDADGLYANVYNGLNGRAKNYGGCENVLLQNDANYSTIGVFNWSSIASQGSGVVVACTLFVQVSSFTAGGNITSHVQMKPYIEGTSCDAALNGSSSWDEWYQHSTSTLDTLFTAKGNVAPTLWGDEGGVFNRGDATGDDRTATMSTTNITNGTGVKAFPIDTTYLNQYLRGNIPQYTVLLVPSLNVILSIYGDDNIDFPANRAYLNIWWGDAVAVTKGTGRFGRAQDGSYKNVR